MILQCFHQSDFARDWSNRVSRGPRNRAEFDAANQFILGHFTTSTFLPSIMKHGLTPDTHKERAVDDRVPSDSKSVYLLTIYDSLYMERAMKRHGGEAISIEVRVKKSALSPDEGQLSPHDLATVDAGEALYLSMCSGACKHHGAIPFTNILSIYYADGAVLYQAEQRH